MANSTVQAIHPNALSEDYYFHVYMYLTVSLPETTDQEVDTVELLRIARLCHEDGHCKLADEMSYYAIHGED